MRPLSKILLTLTLMMVPVSAQAEGAKAKKPSAAASKHSKRKTASKMPKGVISVDKLKQEVASRIAQEKRQAEKAAPKALEGAVAQVKARLGQAIKDGVVTPGELKSVRESYKLMATKSAKKPVAKKPVGKALAKAEKAEKAGADDGEE